MRQILDPEEATVGHGYCLAVTALWTRMPRRLHALQVLAQSGWVQDGFFVLDSRAILQYVNDEDWYGLNPIVMAAGHKGSGKSTELCRGRPGNIRCY